MKRKTTSNALIPRPDLSPGISGGRIAQVFLNTDLRNSHDGLLEIAKKQGVNLARLEAGQYVVFVNEMKNRFKLFAPSPNGRGAIVVYYKSYEGRIDRESIESLPAAFGVRKRLETSDKMATRLDDTLRYQRIRTVNPQ